MPETGTPSIPVPHQGQKLCMSTLCHARVPAGFYFMQHELGRPFGLFQTSVAAPTSWTRKEIMQRLVSSAEEPPERGTSRGTGRGAASLGKSLNASLQIPIVAPSARASPVV